MQLHHWGNGVSGSLHPSQQGLLNTLRSQQRALPVALLHPSAVNQMQVANSEFSHRSENTAQHFGPWEGEHNVKAMTRRWCLTQFDIQAYMPLIDRLDDRLALLTTEQSDTQRVTGFGP